MRIIDIGGFVIIGVGTVFSVVRYFVSEDGYARHKYIRSVLRNPDMTQEEKALFYLLEVSPFVIR